MTEIKKPIATKKDKMSIVITGMSESLACVDNKNGIDPKTSNTHAATGKTCDHNARNACRFGSFWSTTKYATIGTINGIKNTLK